MSAPLNRIEPLHHPDPVDASGENRMNTADAEAIFETWARGTMPTDVLRGYVGDFDDYDLVGDRLMEALGLDDVEVVPRNDDRDDAAFLRRWAYTAEWLLLHQDEDLVVAEFDLIRLVRAAAAPDCAKDEYIAQGAEDHMRNRLNTAAVKGPAALDAELEKLEAELAPLGDLDDWPATELLRRLRSLLQQPVADEHDARALANVLGRCCTRDTGKHIVETTGTGYRVSNIDSHSTTLYVSNGRWILTGGLQKTVEPDWEVASPRGHSLPR